MTFSRRRFLSLISASCLMAGAARAHQWQGTALGAHAQIILDHPNGEEIIRRALAEIHRLEGIFSLYRADSEITRLNTHGRLDAPSFELLDCLSIAGRVHRLTEGRFDATVQPLWRVLAKMHSSDDVLEKSELATARQAIGFERLVVDNSAVLLASGQQITLNGIAQGYIADRVALLMRAEGVTDTLINTGEILALGTAKGGGGWPVKIVGESAARTFSNRAICTSAPLGTVLDSAGSVGHIIDPRSGAFVATNIRQISISASRAAEADALSTALCLVASKNEAEQLLSKFGDARLESIQLAAQST